MSLYRAVHLATGLSFDAIHELTLNQFMWMLEGKPPGKAGTTASSWAEARRLGIIK